MSTQFNQSFFATAGLLKYPYFIIRPVYERSYFHRGVIDELNSEVLRKAYTHCRSITQTHAKTFYMATRFLPNHKQRSIFAIYALCRYIDDLVDETNDLIQQKKVDSCRLEELLSEWQCKLERAYETGEADNPILIAFADTLRTFHIPKKYPLELMEGVCMDLTKNRYENFQELWDYSYKVASVVGLMTSEVVGYASEEAIPRAIDLGIAMQLTNICRDVAEDAGAGRRYLPAALCRWQPEDIADPTPRIRADIRAAVATLLHRAEYLYASGRAGLGALPLRLRLAVAASSAIYRGIGAELRERDHDPLTGRVYVNGPRKLRLACGAVLALARQGAAGTGSARAGDVHA